MAKRAAVVIGVDKTGGQTPLKASALCAERVKEWLICEGYDVELLTDKKADVTIGAIKKAIKRFVKIPAQYHQLVVYFSGHGQYHSYSDHWLLSEAPTDPDAAINLEGAMHLARRSGIANVAFISDACRSVDSTAVGAKVRGSDAFPNLAGIKMASKVDYFKATAEGTVAWEGKIDGAPWSVLTHAWMNAYKTPTKGMVLPVTEGGKTFDVVPNRKLEDHLKLEVNKLLFQLKLISKPQRLDVSVPSEDHIYMARAAKPPATDGTGGGIADALTGDGHEAMMAMSVGIDAGATLARDMSYRGFEGTGGADALNTDLPKTDAYIAARLPVPELTAFESRCGFSIRGVELERAFVAGGQHTGVELLEQGDGQATFGIVRVWNPEAPTTVLLQFRDKRGTMLAALPGYIGHVVVDDQGVASVAYIPSEGTARFNDFAPAAARINRIRGLAALASEESALRLRSTRDATTLLDDITFGTAVDPALALYAAHSLAEAGEDEMIRSLAETLNADLGAVPLDIHVLTDGKWHGQVTPHVPMLTRTWNLLRASGVQLPPPLANAQEHLRDALWTTLEPAGVEIVQPFFKKGF